VTVLPQECHQLRAHLLQRENALNVGDYILPDFLNDRSAAASFEKAGGTERPNYERDEEQGNCEVEFPCARRMNTADPLRAGLRAVRAARVKVESSKEIIPRGPVLSSVIFLRNLAAPIPSLIV
jgi:hypothetical protein